MTNENIITYEKELGINGARSFISPTRCTLQGWLIFYRFLSPLFKDLTF